MFVSEPAEVKEVVALYDDAKTEEGYVPNFLRVWGWRPDVFERFCDTRTTLLDRTSLAPREIAVINATTASRRGDAYCSLAWGSKVATAIDAQTAGALLREHDAPGLTPREQALVTWVSAVVRDANVTTAADVQQLRAAGLSDQEIVDATMIAAFRIAFCTVNSAIGAQPDAQLAESSPREVRESVSYGRPVAPAVDPVAP